MSHNLLVGWQKVEVFLIVQVDRGGLCPVFSEWWGDYYCPYVLLVPRLLLLSYYGGLYFPCDSDDIRRIVSLEISKVTVLLYAAEGATPDYFLGSSHVDGVVGSMIFWSTTFIWTVLTHFFFYKVVERVSMHPVLVALPLIFLTVVDWFSSGYSDDFVA